MKKFFITIIALMMIFSVVDGKILQDYPAIGSGVAVDADLLRIEDMSASTGDRTKKILLSSLITYIYGDNRTMTGTLGMGGYEISGSNIAFTGGTLSGITSIDCDLFDSDNIRINGNTISSTAGTDLNITPLAGQQVVIDGAVTIDAGVVTGITSLTTGALTATGSGKVTGSMTVGARLIFDGTPQTLVGAGEIDMDVAVTRLSLTATSNALTIEDGDSDGQLKIIRVVAEIAGADTGVLEGANFQGTTLTFNHNGSGATLQWDDDLEIWFCIGENGCTYAE